MIKIFLNILKKEIPFRRVGYFYSMDPTKPTETKPEEVPTDNVEGGADKKISKNEQKRLEKAKLKEQAKEKKAAEQS